MSIDISLAGWILSVITFLIGTLIPIIYRRFAYEGFSVRQMLEFKAIIADLEKENELTVNFILKLANSSQESLLIDNIKPIKKKILIQDLHFEQIRTEIKLYDVPLTRQIALPPSFVEDSHKFSDYLPIIIKSNEEKVMALGFRYKFPGNIDEDTCLITLSNFISKMGFGVLFRVNGKYRNFSFQIDPREKDILNLPAGGDKPNRKKAKK